MKYENIEIEVITFPNDDVIVTSGCDPITGAGDEICFSGDE